MFSFHYVCLNIKTRGIVLVDKGFQDLGNAKIVLLRHRLERDELPGVRVGGKGDGELPQSNFHMLCAGKLSTGE